MTRITSRSDLRRRMPNLWAGHQMTRIAHTDNRLNALYPGDWPQNNAALKRLPRKRRMARQRRQGWRPGR